MAAMSRTLRTWARPPLIWRCPSAHVAAVAIDRGDADEQRDLAAADEAQLGQACDQRRRDHGTHPFDRGEDFGAMFELRLGGDQGRDGFVQRGDNASGKRLLTLEDRAFGRHQLVGERGLAGHRALACQHLSCVRQVQQNDRATSAVMFFCSAGRRFSVPA